MNYKQTVEYIESLSSLGIVPGLDNMKELCKRLQNPQKDLKIVHIAGTNGKGSVLSYVSTILKCAGYKTGCYISPTITDYRERFQINGKMISAKHLCSYVEEVKAICDSMQEEGLPHPTPFEVETAIAFLYFARENCDIVVLETGMGGRLDATNTIETPLVAVIASISMDHMKFLGNTLTEIAKEKAGIIKNGCYVISMKQEEEVERVLASQAEKLHCTYVVADAKKASKIRYGIEKQKFNYDLYKDLEIILAGKHQIDNAVLAIETIKALEKMGYPVTEKQLRKGLQTTKWVGRFSIVGKKPLFIVDGAHNQDAAKKLADSIRFYFTNKRIIYIMGVLRDKEYDKIIAETCAYAEQIITVTTPDNPRALPAYELAQAVKEYHPHVTAVDSLEEAVEMAYLLADKDDVIISFGSLSYMGKLIPLVENKDRLRSKKNGR